MTVLVVPKKAVIGGMVIARSLRLIFGVRHQLVLLSVGLHGAAFVEQPLAEILEIPAVHPGAWDDGDAFAAVCHGLDCVHHERGVLVGYLDVARACGNVDRADFLVRGGRMTRSNTESSRVSNADALMTFVLWRT